MVQGSREWHEWRLKGIGASEVAAVIGVSPYMTPYQVWLVKTKRSKGFEGNAATLRGNELEGRARARYELTHLEDMPPAELVHPSFPIVRVSLDGRSKDGTKILEIKCPGEKSHQIAVGGKVPDHYLPQVHYQMAASGAEECDFFSYYEGKDGTVSDALVNVKKSIQTQVRLVSEVINFWEKYVVPDVPPPLTEKDCLIIENNPEFETLCKQLIIDKEKMSKDEVDAYKSMLVELSGHTKFRCNNVQISEVKRGGKFSYHKLTIVGGK